MLTRLPFVKHRAFDRARIRLMISSRIPVRPTPLTRLFQALRQPGARSALALLLGPWASSAVAQSAASELPGITAASLLQTALALAAVIGVLFLVAYLLRRVNGGRSFGSNGPLRVVGGLMVGPRERIVLVEIGDTWIVVGLVPGQIRTLHTLPKGELGSGGDGERHFAQWLRQIAERKNEDR